MAEKNLETYMNEQESEYQKSLPIKREATSHSMTEGISAPFFKKPGILIA